MLNRASILQRSLHWGSTLLIEQAGLPTAIVVTIVMLICFCPARAGPAEEANALNQEALQYSQRGDYKHAEEALRRALSIVEKAVGPDDVNVAQGLINLAILFYNLGRYADAEPLFKRALAIREKALGSDRPEVAEIANDLAIVHLKQGHYAEAESLHKRALAIREKALGPNHVNVAQSLSNLANIYGDLGNYRLAETLDQRALAIVEKALGPNHADVGTSLNNLALIYKHQGRYADAEPLLKRALAIREQALGPDHKSVATTLDNLAELSFIGGRYAAAEAMFRRSLTIREKLLGTEHVDVALSYENLAAIYVEQGRFNESVAFLQRALAIREKALGPNHMLVARSVDNLANLYHRQGRYAEAEPLFKQALAIRERALGANHVDVAFSLSNLANLYETEGRQTDAEPLLRRALAIREKTLGPDHTEVARNLSSLGFLYESQGRYSEAEQLTKRALTIREKALGPDHVEVARSLDSLSVAYMAQGRYDEALAASRRAVAILTKRSEETSEGSDPGGVEQKSQRLSFVRLVHLLTRLSATSSDNSAIIDEAFRTAQNAGGIETARALAGMSARYAAGSDALARLVRERQDLFGRWRSLDAALVTAMSQPPEKRNPAAEEALRKEETDIDARVAADDQKLRAEFPRFAELASARPVGVADVQNVLEPNEALVVWMLANPDSFLFVVRHDRAQLFRLGIAAAQVAEVVRSLRGSLDLAGRTLIDLEPLDIAKAHDLYNHLLGPADSLIKDAEHLIVVADGPLQSLPPALLVSAPPAGAIEKFSDYKSVAWLIRRHALSVLPAVSSLVSLRRVADTRRAKIAFAGFGDPNFNGDSGAMRGVKLTNLLRGGDAAAEGLHSLPRLRETADELRAEAAALGAPASAIHLGAEASVTTVKRTNLASTRVVAFATHGLIAGELPKLAEPALALSPPAHPTTDDDGLLRASQVSQLKLDAEFVILSACNTAAPDGTPGAEGLSGLAKAFFYAGARSLLVSHWPVDSAAAVKVTTGAFRALTVDRSIGRAEALRRSMIAMIDNAPENSYDAHPLAWAPFVLAGEGGRGR
ncbi:MAG: CHAT domain-containing protein [Rhodopseudomonas sp.]|uniref:CHAT domain-containing tetratricopeptide repeat protein n=1 Tax=Rhodopseudomonas sp. TaxID=1078 RepID=UPI0017C52437|nr:CHAT domain-containing tetratricopeptide repeat protein [Rhodopseudomonas sp.]NVN88269.1 CHAT domain-containing protein [Rhodopseudomonas sp.]